MLKVGVFDSGLGGLTVVKALTETIKGAELYYLADTKNAPYGEKTVEEILQFSLDITQYFIDTHQIDALIIACNTATSAAIQTLRTRYPHLIIIGTEPGVKPAITLTKTGKIGVMATPATLKGEKYQDLVAQLAKDKNIKLFEQACPGLVEQIEKGQTHTVETKKLLENWVLPMRENNVDTIVLGCTHYPLVSDTISEIMLGDVMLIETGTAIANRLLHLAISQGHTNQGELIVHIHFSGEIEKDLIKNLLPLHNKLEFVDFGKL
jgi:glutamate racemase